MQSPEAVEQSFFFKPDSVFNPLSSLVIEKSSSSFEHQKIRKDIKLEVVSLARHIKIDISIIRLNRRRILEGKDKCTMPTICTCDSALNRGVNSVQEEVS